MTCLVGIKKTIKNEMKVLLASDSLATYGSLKLVNTVNDSKIFPFPNFTVAISGEGPISEILEGIYRENTWAAEEVNTRMDCAYLMQQFQDRFSDRIPESANENLKYEFLIGTKDKLFWCLSEPSVFEIDDYWAAGSGSDFALGALFVLHSQIGSGITMEQAAKKAISAACRFNQDCEPPIDVRII